MLETGPPCQVPSEWTGNPLGGTEGRRWPGRPTVIQVYNRHAGNKPDGNLETEQLPCLKGLFTDSASSWRSWVSEQVCTQESDNSVWFQPGKNARGQSPAGNIQELKEWLLIGLLLMRRHPLNLPAICSFFHASGCASDPNWVVSYYSPIRRPVGKQGLQA